MIGFPKKIKITSQPNTTVMLLLKPLMEEEI